MKCADAYLYATSVLQIERANTELLLMARNRISSKMENVRSAEMSVNLRRLTCIEHNRQMNENGTYLARALTRFFLKRYSLIKYKYFAKRMKRVGVCLMLLVNLVFKISD